MDEYDDESYTRKAGVPWKVLALMLFSLSVNLFVIEYQTEISDRFSLAFEKDIMIKKHNRSLDDELFGRMQNYEVSNSISSFFW